MPAPIIKPSHVATYFDWKRFAQLTCVQQSDNPPATMAGLDSSARAVEWVRTAYNDLLMAAAKGEKYTVKQIEDLVVDFLLKNDGKYRGQQVVKLVADLTWKIAVISKRYVKDSPQSQDATITSTEDDLMRLRTGEKIFVLEGVNVTGDDYEIQSPPVYYGPEVQVAGHTTGGDGEWMRAGYPAGLWGCKTLSTVQYPYGRSGNCG